MWIDRQLTTWPPHHTPTIKQRIPVIARVLAVALTVQVIAHAEIVGKAHAAFVPVALAEALHVGHTVAAARAGCRLLLAVCLDLLNDGRCATSAYELLEVVER